MRFVSPRPRKPVPPQHWYRSAALDERLRLFTLPSVAAFFGAMCVALWLALPGASLADRLAQSARNDPLTVAYLRAWLAAEPQDLPLHLALARKHLRLGDWDAAVAALARPIAAGDPAVRRDAQWLKLEILEARTFAAPLDSEARSEAAADVIAQVRRLAALEAEGPGDAAAIDALLRRARAAGEVPLARELLSMRGRLAPPAGLAPDAWFARLSADTEALGDPLGAARLRWRAFDAAATDGERRVHFFAAVRMMQSADRSADALAEADARVGRLQADTGLLRFMVRLAMAAGRPDVADRYAREMLRFAMIEWLAAHRQVAADVPALRPASLGAARPKQPQLPFDETTYALAFEVFLANRSLDDAFEVAAAAVRARPDDLTWRRRLAQVSEWTARGADALAQRLAIARATSDPREWAVVERLAGQLGDGEALLESLRVRAARADDEALDARVARAIEDQGRPREALEWLATRIVARGPARSRMLMDRQYALLEALGDDAGLLAWLDRAQAEYGPDPALAMRRSALHLRRGDTARAFAALHAVRDAAARAAEPPAVAGSDETFWHLYARLALRLQREDDADFAYRRLLAAGRADADDLIEWSVLLEDRSVRAAAVAAQAAWRKGLRPEHGDRAFSLWLRAGDFAALDALARELDPSDLARLRADRGYLQALSAHLQALGDDAGARRAIEQAIALAPEDVSLRASLLWMLIAQRAAAPLRAQLARGEARAEREPALWGPYAAAWMALDEPQRALHWFVRQARKADGDDYLWQLAYADCLEQNGLADSAWSVRRRAWIELRRMPAPERDADPWRRQATVALAMRFASTDATRDAIRQLVAEREAIVRTEAAALPDRRAEAAAAPPHPAASPPATSPPATSAAAASPHAASPAVPAPNEPRTLAARIDDELARSAPATGTGPDDDGSPGPDARLVEARALAAGSRELATSWLLSRESSDAARAWLLSRYARQLARPAWAELSIALASNDTEALAALLDDLPDWLPKMERVDAMRATGRRADAQTLAWTVASQRPAVDDAHQRLVDATLPDASFALAEAVGAEIGVLGLRGPRLQLQRALRPGLSAGIVAEHFALRTLDEAQLTGVPASESRVGATLSWRGEATRVDADVSRYLSIRDRTGLRVALRPAPESDRGVSATLGLGQPATESAALRVGGRKDMLELRWGQPLTARDRLSASVTPIRLSSQDGTLLATGTVWTLEATHRLRLEYPDLALKALAIRSDWRARPVADAVVAPLVPAALGDPTAAIVPGSSTEAAAGVSFGDTVTQTYSRALRPFGEALLRANSVSGGGYALRAGLTSSLLGTDRLSAFLGLTSRSPGLPRGTRAFGLAYQFLF